MPAVPARNATRIAANPRWHRVSRTPPSLAYGRPIAPASTTSTRPTAPGSLAVRATPFLFVLIWASGFVVAKYAAPYAEPLSFLLLRYTGVVVLMGSLALVARATWPRWRQAGHLAVAGIGIQAGYLGGVWAAIAAGMPAGVAALVVNLQPVLTAVVGWLLGEPMGARRATGLVLGFLGVTLVVSAKLTTNGLSVLTVGLTTLALVAITAGTLYQKRFCPEFDLRTGQVVQFAASIVVTAPFVVAFESFRVTWTLELAGALAWSILVLTGGGISLLFLMLRRGAASQVTSYFYLVPGITAVMAFGLFGEQLGWIVLAGMAATVIGVALAAGGRVTQPAEPAPTPSR
ncbi:peptide ABC transporter ATP-binding protein [Pseudonocardia asaccharolytica DSM 44247 = NBRC 16224]|uniref:Peptide ABC transporter ATP-binding protein n=1 Tax=Pseudonocardia asaccharolytica DSM 44247 = NBRC 16224 TaxID=1123024 RepID=A0A511CUX1_9PSEU|nr:peptide ABC transporter ATP-binding protein [Pseudonocardia asaccharolytica DSM 44247 = NBRC 16224]